jgi:copper resistance protein C
MRRRTLRAAGVVAGLVLALVVVGAPAAQAHDALVGTEPADGATLPVAPAEVTLRFGEPAVAMGTEVEVTSPDGAVVSSGDPVLVDTTVRQALDGDLPAGTYTVTWRVTSQDGHAVSGTFAFTAAEASGAAVPTSPATPASSATPSPSSASSTAPSTAAATATPSSADGSASDDEGSTPALAVVGAGLLVGVLFGLLGWARTRRQRASDGADRP